MPGRKAVSADRDSTIRTTHTISPSKTAVGASASRAMDEANSANEAKGWPFRGGNRIRRSHPQSSFPDPAHTKSQWPMVRTSKSAYKTSLLHMSSKFNLLEAAFTSIRPALYSAILYFGQTRDRTQPSAAAQSRNE